MVNGNNNDHDHREGSRGADEVNEARSELNNGDSIPQMYASFVPFMRRIVSASVRESLSLFTSIKGIVLIILVAQSCIGLLLTRYTRARPVVPEAGDPPLFSVPSAVMCTEAIKLFVCFWWVFCTEFPTNNTSSATSGRHSNTNTSNGSVVGGGEGGCGGTRRDRAVSPTGAPISSSSESATDAKTNSNGSSLSRLAHILTSPRRLYAQCVFVLRSALLHRDAWHMLPPALLFTFQSNIIYVALQNVEVTLFQVLYQSKLLLTALFVGYAFKRSFNRMQWISLFCLFIGVVVSQLGSAGNSSGKGGSPSKLQTNRGGGGGGRSGHAKQKRQNDASLAYSGISAISMTAANENSRSLEQAHPTLGINNQEDAAAAAAVPTKEGQQDVSIVESAYIPAAAVEEPKEKGPAAVVSEDCADSGDVCVEKSVNAQNNDQPKGGEHQDGDKEHIISHDEKQKVRSHQAASLPVEFSSGRKLLSLGDENKKEDEKVEPDALLASKNDGMKAAPTRAEEDEDEKIELPSSTTEASESPPAQQRTTKKGSRKAKEVTASAASTSSSSSLFGIVALLASSVSSAIAAVVMEKVLKDASSPQSLAVRNVQLAIFSLGLTGIVYYYNTLSKAVGMSTATLASSPREGSGGLTASSYLSSSNTWDRPYPPPLLYDAFGEFFLGFDAYVWALVVNQAVGGILVALVLKYADNILKGFAVAVCIFICGLFSWLVWDTHLAPGFVLGATIVTFSVVTYSVASSKGA